MIRLFFIFCLMVAAQLTAQETTDKKAMKLVEKANEEIKSRRLPDAKELLLSAITRDSTYGEAYLRLFAVLNSLRENDELYQWQVRYVNNVPAHRLNKQVWQALAYDLFRRGEYAEAQSHLANAERQDSLLKASIAFALEQSQKEANIAIEELPPQINRYAHQYLPVLTIDGRTLIFTARRSDQSDEDIVISHFDGSDWSEAAGISPKINSPYNEGACTISADGRTLIFTACEGRQSYGSCDLYISRKTGDEWSTPENLGSSVNSTSWDSQPALSADGNTLYFVSSRPGGVGARDIWISSFDGERWTTAKNLGTSVNTRLDDTTPYIYSDGHTLFFSSNGHVGMGGFDLYKVDVSADVREVQNLGYPINTFHDEVSLFITSDGRTAYFTKEKSDKDRITESRLVTYDLSGQSIPEVVYVTGQVLEDSTHRPLEATIELVDLEARQTDYRTMSDPTTGRFYFVLPSGKAFGAFVEREGYLPVDISFTALALRADTLDVYLQPIRVGAKFVLQNIYFAHDSDQLDDRSSEELDRVAKFLRDHPRLRVEISGHTDNVGSPDYNLSLSQRRADSVYHYLIRQGIAANRLKTRGAGASEPRNENRTASERERNRRIEFKTLEVD